MSFGMGIASVNPATGGTLREFAEHDEAAIEAALAAAAGAFPAWSAAGFAARGAVLARAAGILEAGKRRYA